MQEQYKSDLELANELLYKLKGSITKQDKQKLFAQTNINPSTLSKYLNMGGVDLSTCIELIEFFTPLIEARRVSLKQQLADILNPQVA